jgi:hypothetical protein
MVLAKRCSTSAVCSRPGITVLQRMPFLAYEIAVDLENARMPSLVVE